MRCAETIARGTIIKIIVMTWNDMMICIAYWMYAIISPTCIVESAIAWPPTHMMSSETRFISSIMNGIANDMTRWVKRFVHARS